VLCSTFLVIDGVNCDAEREEVNTSGVYTLTNADGTTATFEGVPLQGQLYWTGPSVTGVVVFTHGAFTSGPTGYSDEDFFAVQYDYLMRCLAQQGFLAISVRSGPGTSPADRANLMLLHLARLEEISEQHGVLINQNIPLAFAGHSRGGQAAALAPAAIKKGAIPGFSSVAAVVCLAPSTQGETPSPEEGAFDSYLAIAGTHDGDVDSAKSLVQFELVDPFIPFKAFVWVHRANHSGFTESESFYLGDQGISSDITEEEALPREVQQTVTQELVAMFLRWRLLGETEYAELFRQSSASDIVGALLPDEEASGFRAYIHFTENWAVNPPCENACYFVGFLDDAPVRAPFEDLDPDCRSKREGFRLRWEDIGGGPAPMMIFDLVANEEYVNAGPLIPNSASSIEFELAKVVRSEISLNAIDTVVHVSLWAAVEGDPQGDPWGEVATVSVAAPGSRRIPQPSEDLSSTVPATFRLAIDAFGGPDFRARVQAIVLTFLDGQGDMLVTRPRFF